jgi:hypothetical protein
LFFAISQNEKAKQQKNLETSSFETGNRFLLKGFSIYVVKQNTLGEESAGKTFSLVEKESSETTS